MGAVNNNKNNKKRKAQQPNQAMFLATTGTSCTNKLVVTHGQEHHKAIGPSKKAGAH